VLLPSGGIFDLDARAERLTEVSRELEDPAVWNQPERAQELGRERARLEEVVLTLTSLTQALVDAAGLLEMAAAEHDQETFDVIEADLEALDVDISRLEFRRMFSGEMDESNAFVDIQAGSGGTEAQDWAEMLLRMYLRWVERHDFKSELIEVSPGDVAGIKSATLKVEGSYAFGWLRTEIGVHRLVRKSPFDSGNRRHTSFAAVFVSPEIDEDVDIEINPADLRIDVYRASGAGGQHVNRTESAVRITHIPTNIVVQCQNDRSQHKNRATAMKMLQARLYEAELKKREDAAQAEHEAKTDIGWGHQIRSYVLQPYQMIKDLRTGAETSDTQGVLNGDIDLFLQASLAARVIGSEDEED